MKNLFFPFIALLVVLPWFFTPGYLLLLDWQGTPVIPAFHLDQTGGVSGTPIQLFLHVIAFITGSAFAQKFLIFIILATTGYSTARLSTEILPEKTSPSIAYISGIYAMLNPFVYNRIQMGHIYLLAGYALTPLAIFTTLKFIKKPSLRSALLASFFCSAIITISIHHIILLPLILGCYIWIIWKKVTIRPSHYAALLVPFFITIAIVLISVTRPSSILHTIGKQDLSFFAPMRQCSQSLIIDTALLATIWRNNELTHTSCESLLFLIPGMLLLGIMLIGIHRNKKIFFVLIFFIALSAFPVIPVMRDSAKFLSNLAIVECILLAYGSMYIAQKNKYLLVLPIVLVCIIGLPLFWGLSGTITPHEYPASWYAWNSSLTSHEKEKPNTLFLPWHLYMPFDFTNQQTIGNPAVNFFTNANIIQGDNLEIKKDNQMIITQSSRSVSKKIESTLAQINTQGFPEALRLLLAQEHIQYIALAHGSPEQVLYQTAFQAISFLHKEYDAQGLTVWRFTQ